MRSKILVIILVIVLIGSVLLPVVPASMSGSRAPRLRVTSIDIIPVTGEHDECPYYLNKTHSFEINLRNTGDSFLENINVSFQIIKQGSIVELEDYKSSTVDLAPGETTDTAGPITFSWAPSEINKWYRINVTSIKADVFGTTKKISTDENGLNLTIKHISNDADPIDFGLLGMKAAEHNGA